MNKIILNSLFVFFSFSILAQNSSNGKNLKKIDIDSLSNMTIEKIIFYKVPIELEYYSLTDCTYIPKWYNAFCANHNMDYFSDYPNEAIKYMSKSMGLNKDVLRSHYDNILSQGGIKEVIKKVCLTDPYLKYNYIYSEFWIKQKDTDLQYIYIQGIYSDKRIPKLIFDKSLKPINSHNELTDSIKNQTRLTEIFVIENDTVKLVNQEQTLVHTLTNGRFDFASNLSEFKNILYRTQMFIQSNIVNGKRVFETMKKGKTGHQKIKESDKP